MRRYRRGRGEYPRKKPRKSELTYLFKSENRIIKMAAGP
jgi:hypothetical protein